jgi:tRNA threonylcarbamoyladenosine biosynthesis protein TsaB
VSSIRILQIETATTTCSVACAEDGNLIALKSVSDGYKHAENVFGLIREVLAEANWKTSDLNAIAISAGPGSYTGLRIGVSAAKGLCYSLDIPLIASSTLFTLAKSFKRQFPEVDTYLSPMIDARRMEVYTSIYSADLHAIKSDHPLIVTDSEVIPELNDHVITFFGDGAGKCQEVLGVHPNARFVDGIELSAQDMSASAYESFQLGAFADLAYFEPEYLKPYHGTKPLSTTNFGSEIKS